ncbi:MAG: imidazolonepropionase [Bacteroidales bacterium]|nr:imidazolonepropionase [Bacteroidales bacterium]
MQSILIHSIGTLAGVWRQAPKRPLRGASLASLPVENDCWLSIRDGLIEDWGPMDTCPASDCDILMDAKKGTVLPSWCDSHTHLVYAGSREREWVDKLNGLSYQEVARRGGGILNSVALLHETPEQDLLSQSLARAREIIRQGTGAVEIKSGYGLSLEDEMKMLRVARSIDEQTPLTVKTTLLAAHAVPVRYAGCRERYVDEIITEMIPAVAAEGLAQYVDIFCEEGFFTVEDAARIFEAASKYGLVPKVHANQLSASGGVEIGIKYGAASVDHLECTGPEQWKALASSDTIATLLPGATFFMDLDYCNARGLIDSGAAVALASNYNPGSCPGGDMKFMCSLASIAMKMLPSEALNAATLNGAFAMGVEKFLGSISPGKKANLQILSALPSLDHLTYAFNTSYIKTIILDGKII